MAIEKEERRSVAVKFSIRLNNEEAGRAYLYLIKNDLHREPYGLLEDVFVVEAFRGRGLGRDLVKSVIEEAKARQCYKLVADSRYSNGEVHLWYEKLGFKDYGKEFRLDFKSRP